MSRQPDHPPPPPVVQRLRIRYAKRDRMRFTSHRDVARALERALRRAEVPMAYSAGFTPHPKISYAGASPTGVASEAEFLEIGLAVRAEPDEVRERLDAALPPGLDVVQVVEATGPGFGERLNASRWRVELPEADPTAVADSVERFLALTSVPVERLTKDGRRTVDARSPVVAASVRPGAASGAEAGHCATIEMVVRHTTPAVRPDDVMTAMRQAAALPTPVTPRVTRLAQGLLDETPPASGPSPQHRSTNAITLRDPLAPDAAEATPPS